MGKVSPWSKGDSQPGAEPGSAWGHQAGGPVPFQPRSQPPAPPQKCLPSPGREGVGLKGLNISSRSCRVRTKCSNKESPSFTAKALALGSEWNRYRRGKGERSYLKGKKGKRSYLKGENGERNYFQGTPQQGPHRGEVAPWNVPGCHLWLLKLPNCVPQQTTPVLPMARENLAWNPKPFPPEAADPGCPTVGTHFVLAMGNPWGTDPQCPNGTPACTPSTPRAPRGAAGGSRTPPKDTHRPSSPSCPSC